MPENAFSVINSHVNISWRARYQRYRRLTTSSFFLFLMENSIQKIFGSMDVKITPDFC